VPLIDRTTGLDHRDWTAGFVPKQSCAGHRAHDYFVARLSLRLLCARHVGIEAHAVKCWPRNRSDAWRWLVKNAPS